MKKEIFEKAKKKKNFWDEFEELYSKSSWDELSIKNSSLNKSSSNKDNIKVDNKWGYNIYKRLRD